MRPRPTTGNRVRSRRLTWRRWERTVIERALSRLAGIAPAMVQPARLAVNGEGWIDMNCKAGKRLAELCAQETPGEVPIWDGPNRNL